MEMTFHFLHAAYVVALLWYLSRKGPSLEALPEVHPVILPKRRAGAWIQVVIVALVFVLIVGSADGMDILLLFILVTVVWMLVAWWRKIRFLWLIQGLRFG